MNKLLSAAVGFLLLAITPALAQSTAAQVIPGFMTTTGCPSGSTVCFKTAASYAHISTATNTQVFTGVGEVFNVTVNSKAGGSATATLYDGASCTGTIVATIDLNSSDPVTLIYDAKLTTGLCITTSAAADLTVTYRTN